MACVRRVAGSSTSCAMACATGAGGVRGMRSTPTIGFACLRRRDGTRDAGDDWRGNKESRSHAATGFREFASSESNVAHDDGRG